MSFSEYRLPTEELKEMDRDDWHRAVIQCGQFIGVGGVMMTIGMKSAAATAVTELCLARTGACATYIQTMNATMQRTLLLSAFLLVVAILADVRASTDDSDTEGRR